MQDAWNRKLLVVDTPKHPHAKIVHTERTYFTREIDHEHLFSEVMNICLSPACAHLALFVPKPNDDNTVVCWEARGAKRMPQLKVMELWGDRRSVSASIFRLERRERQPGILLLVYLA